MHVIPVQILGYIALTVGVSPGIISEAEPCAHLRGGGNEDKHEDASSLGTFN